MKNKNKTFEITIIAILACCNATLESTIGNYLHMIRLPFYGVIMIFFNILIYSAGYLIINKKGTILTIGFLTALLSGLLGGAMKPISIVAIFVESALMETIILFIGVNQFSLICSGILLNVFSFIYSILIASFLIYHVNFSSYFVDKIGNIVNNHDLIRQSIWLFFIGVILLHAVSGVFTGLIACKFNKIVKNIMKNLYTNNNIPIEGD